MEPWTWDGHAFWIIANVLSRWRRPYTTDRSGGGHYDGSRPPIREGWVVSVGHPRGEGTPLYSRVRRVGHEPGRMQSLVWTHHDPF